MVHKYLNDIVEDESIEVSNEQISAGIPVLLQVRRGSESALNQLLPDAGVSDGNTSNGSQCSSGYRKRWSAAAPLSQESKEKCYLKLDDIMSINMHSRQQQNERSYLEADENEEKDIFIPRKISSRFTRDGSNRLSMQFYGDQRGSVKWADAAERLMSNRVFSLSLPREHGKKAPLSQNNSNVSKTVDAENSEYVVLQMDNNEPLGIHVVPDYDWNGNDRGLLVQRIDPGKKVAQDGRLAVNDRIVEINKRNLLNKSFNTVQYIFQKSLKSPELRLRVVKHNCQLSSAKPTNSVLKIQPPPVHPKPSVNQPTHPMHNKENLAMIESEEKNIGFATKVATVSPTKKLQSTPHTGSHILMAVNTRKIGRLIEIELTKGSDGLGFTLTSRDNPIGGNVPIYIKNILSKGAAVEDGRLKCGDRLLSVNGVDLCGKTQADAVAEVRKVPPGGKVKIVVSRQKDIESQIEAKEPVEVHIGAPVNNIHTPSKMLLQDCDVVDSAPKSSVTKPLSQGVDQSSIFPWRQREILSFDVPVHDSEMAGLGISVKGKTSTVAGQKQGSNEMSIDMGIFINSVLHGGAASRDGRLRKNDQLLNVNGISLLGLSNSAAMETLRRAIVYTEGPKSGAITLTVARKIGNSSIHQKRKNSSLFSDSFASTNEAVGCIEHDNVGTASTDNSVNSEHSDNTVIFLPSTKPQSKPPEIVPSRNLILERLTGQLPTHSGLRNESYYRATHQTSIMLLGKDNNRLTSPTINQSPGDMVIIEEDPPYSSTREIKVDQPAASEPLRGSTSSTHEIDVTYASQLSLDDAGGFSRDAFGRQSMSEKRHATLDAKSTDTYKRNKKMREEREKQRIYDSRRSTIGLVKMNSTESIPRSDRNDNLAKNQVGPALGMKKSSSLESLQTMVQEIQMAEDGVYRRNQVYTRGCNESFRAAVDRSYEATHLMDPVPEIDGCHLPPRQLSLNSQLDCKIVKQHHHQNKKKSSLLKGLGSMFRFGRHRKPTIVEEVTSLQKGVAQKNAEEKERAKKAAKEEQERIQEQYKLLLQRQMGIQLHQQQQQQPPKQQQQQQSQQQQLNLYQNQEMHNGLATQYIQTNNININNNYIPMKQIRSRHHQYRYVDRRSLFPPETKEEYYNGGLRQNMIHTNAEQMFNNANRPNEKFTPLTESNRYSHYVNYKEIQQHLNRRQQHYHSQRHDNREMSHRPVSNFYEYESIQSMMQNQGIVPSRTSLLDASISAAAASRNEFYPSTLYGSTRVRNCERPYSMYQNSNIPYPTQFSLPQKQFPFTTAPLYSNVRPLTKNQGPYITQVTIRDNHYTSNSLGTKV